MRAYDEIYLIDGKKHLANCFDYAINIQHIDGENFVMSFTSSSYAKLFEIGNPHVIAGIAGVELAQNILHDKMGISKFNKQVFSIDKSKEYWLGYYMAHYQWFSNISFSIILDDISYSDLLKMYYPYHEMDIEHYINEMSRRIYESELKKTGKKISPLKKYREFKGMSQNDLSNISGVNVRTIRLYEQKPETMRKAEYKILEALSKSLNRSIDDIVYDNKTITALLDIME